jgi:hypothetical protein
MITWIDNPLAGQFSHKHDAVRRFSVGSLVRSGLIPRKSLMREPKANRKQMSGILFLKGWKA